MPHVGTRNRCSISDVGGFGTSTDIGRAAGVSVSDTGSGRDRTEKRHGLFLVKSPAKFLRFSRRYSVWYKT